MVMIPAGLGHKNECTGETGSSCKRQICPLVSEDAT
jgi:hypothetical protein